MPRGVKNPDAPVKVTYQDAYDVLPEPVDGPGEFVQNSIRNAVELLNAKAEILSELQQTRDFLAFAVTSGQVSDEQSAWISEYLPKRSHKNGDEAEPAEGVES
jgi:hypothetical protein